MHEFAIVSSLLQVIEEEAAKHGAKKVTKVVLKVGRFSGIEVDLLKTAFDTFKEKTICEEAELLIEVEELKLFCTDCGRESVIEGKPTRKCPLCGSLRTRIVGGQELYLKSLELETDDTPAETE